VFLEFLELFLLGMFSEWEKFDRGFTFFTFIVLGNGMDVAHSFGQRRGPHGCRS
jgi:hypothetical protein